MFLGLGFVKDLESLPSCQICICTMHVYASFRILVTFGVCTCTDKKEFQTNKVKKEKRKMCVDAPTKKRIRESFLYIERILFCCRARVRRYVFKLHVHLSATSFRPHAYIERSTKYMYIKERSRVHNRSEDNEGNRVLL